MAKATEKTSYNKQGGISQHSGAGGIWFLGFIGTLAYYLHYHSGSFKLVIIAIFKATFWLVYLVYYLLRFMRV